MKMGVLFDNEIYPKYMAFAALINSIDGKKVTDLSDDNLKNIIADINKVRHSSLINFLYNIKKKFSQN